MDLPEMPKENSRPCKRLHWHAEKTKMVTGALSKVFFGSIYVTQGPKTCRLSEIICGDTSKNRTEGLSS